MNKLTQPQIYTIYFKVLKHNDRITIFDGVPHISNPIKDKTTDGFVWWPINKYGHIIMGFEIKDDETYLQAIGREYQRRQRLPNQY